MTVKKKLPKKKASKKEVSQEEKEARSRRGRGSKRKGATYERKVAKIFKETCDLDLSRTPQSGGFAKKSQKADDFRGDIVCLDVTKDFKLHVECKNQKTLKIRDWLEQAQSDCPNGKTPIVIYHLDQVIKEGKVTRKSGEYVTLSLSDFLNLVDVEKIIEEKEI